jgi:hypothetical protein
VVKAIGLPLRLMLVNEPAPEAVGTIACRFLAPAPIVIVKLNVLPFQNNEPNDEELRPSSHCSICNEETMGTPRDCAEDTIASDPADAMLSVCILAVKAP